MRNIALPALAIPVRGFGQAISWLRRSPVAQPAMLVGAVALVVTGLLVGLPVKPAVAQPLPTFAALAPQADAHRTQGNLPLDVPFQVQFTKPMNENTVQSAFTITPRVEVRFQWDATGQVLSVAPNPHWQPFTQYTIDISPSATDQVGLSLSTPVHSSFQSGSPTAGQITATKMVLGLAAPTTAFQITFTRPVKLATVLMRMGISPQVDLSIVGDDPTDAASQVFTLTPKKALVTNLTYLVSMTDGGTDSAGATLQPVTALEVKTLPTPAVVKITPQDGTITYDTNQPISIQFSTAMDAKSAVAALSVKSNGRTVSGSTNWTADAMTLAFTPSSSFYVGSSISVTVAASARSAGGLAMAGGASSGFTVSTPRTRRYITTTTTTTKIPWTGGIASATRPYHEAEIYYLSLMNCTRTGGWVTSDGSCSTETHHTLTARTALAFDDGISDNVARPYAMALADRAVLTHTLDGTTTHSRMAAGGYGGSSWGENIASPGSAGAGGMISIETFFQSEAPCRCAHYYNIMDPYFHRAGVGIWVSNSTRVVIDFYG